MADSKFTFDVTFFNSKLNYDKRQTHDRIRKRIEIQ